VLHFVIELGIKKDGSESEIGDYPLDKVTKFAKLRISGRSA